MHNGTKYTVCTNIRDYCQIVSLLVNYTRGPRDNIITFNKNQTFFKSLFKVKEFSFILQI